MIFSDDARARWQAYLRTVHERELPARLAEEARLEKVLRIETKGAFSGGPELIRPLLASGRSEEERQKIVYATACGLSLAFEALERGDSEQAKTDVARALLYLTGWNGELDMPASWRPRDARSLARWES